MRKTLAQKKAMAKRMKKPILLKPAKRQTASPGGNSKMDSKRTALKPGKRISKNGKVYYEYRSNRSDLDKRKKR